MSDLKDDVVVETFEPCAEQNGVGVKLEDFRAYMPMHNYIFTPCREIWPATSVNARLKPMPLLDKDGKPMRYEDETFIDKNGQPKQRKGRIITIPASKWLDRNQPVEQMTWCPGLSMLIRDRLVVLGGWIERKDVTCFNLYRPSRIKLGDASKAGPWINHIHKVYPDDASHIIRWLAQRVQNPSEKINHALVLGGAPGIGKDSLLASVRHAVGPWNFVDVSPTDLLGRFNGYRKSVILRVSEGHDLGESNRFSFYQRTKIYAAAPPEVLRVDEKNLREYYVFNCLGLLITTNHKTDGIYLPPDDRRHYVAWSNLVKEDFPDEYWDELWGWYNNGGLEHVAAYLTELDISAFDPKAPPPKTAAFWDIVNASAAPEDGELLDVIDALGNPDALIILQLIAKATGETSEWLMERKNRRSIPHRLERCGYVAVRNQDCKDGLWIVQGARHVIYAKAQLTPKERLQAARNLLRQQSH